MRELEWTVADALHERYRHIAGSPVDYDVRPYFEVLRELERPELADLPASELEARAREVRRKAATTPLDGLLPEVFAIGREAAARTLRLRPYDVQIAAGVALHRGRVAQLATGEGKTLAAVLPAALHAMPGRGVHIFTANDYLARRDAEWMAPVYAAFGLRSAHVIQGMSAAERRAAYAADVTYVTAKEAGFDYLRDHAALDSNQIVHRGHAMAIVDEADFILIDEARVPLVIAGPAPSPGFDPARVAAVVERLTPAIDFTADEYGRTVILTEAGFDTPARCWVCRLEDADEQLMLSAVHVALHARTLLRRDRDYVVREGGVEIVDEWTGRVAENRRWPHGIQPAVEAKEKVEVRAEGRVLGSIPMQHFVRHYGRLAGMTATAEPAADELFAFFGLRTVVFPPNQPCHRVDEPDDIFTDRRAKHAAVIDEVVPHARGRAPDPRRNDQRRRVRGARRQPRGARRAVPRPQRAAGCARGAVIARAGVQGAVTIATNMAGRGTDIVLGGGDPAAHAAVAALGGLYVIGTNRHESQRIDDRLRGRAGRQGDPGGSRFFISLEDDLIRRYGVMSLIPPAHRPQPQAGPLDDPIVAREIARAQRIIEGQNFDIRRTLWKYSAMVDEQRQVVFEWRQALLDGEADPGICRETCADHYAELVARAGAPAGEGAEQSIVMHVIDRRWSDHLAFIEDVREGIHLQRYGGREPVQEFHKQIVDEFSLMMEHVRRGDVGPFPSAHGDERPARSCRRSESPDRRPPGRTW